MKKDVPYVRGTYVPKTFLEPLGYLSVWFALLEQNINAALAQLLSLHADERGKLVAAQFNSMAAKIRLIRLTADSHLKNPTSRKILKTFLDSAEKASAARNEILHGDWNYSIEVLKRSEGADIYIDSSEIQKTSINRDGKKKSVKVSVGSINNAALLAFNSALKIEIGLQLIISAEKELAKQTSAS